MEGVIFGILRYSFLFLPPIDNFLGAALCQASAIYVFLVLLQCNIFIQHLIPSGKVLS